MIGDQALQHFGKPFGWALAADALHADARAFAEEEDLVCEELGFRELGLAAERDEPLSETALEFLDHPSRRHEPRRSLPTRRLSQPPIGASIPPLRGPWSRSDGRASSCWSPPLRRWHPRRPRGCRDDKRDRARMRGSARAELHRCSSTNGWTRFWRCRHLTC